MNKFIGIGNLCKDIELKQTNSGKSYLQNSIAIRNDFKNANGEYDSEFVNIVAWNKTAEYLVQYAHKGMKIAVEGKITTRSYDKEDGAKGYITEIVCNSVELLEKKTGFKNDESKDTLTNNSDPYEDFGNEIELDDNFLDD